MKEIKQEHKDKADRYIELFEQIEEVFKNHKSIFSFMKNQYFPEYGVKNKHSRDVIKFRVVAEIMLEEDSENISINKEIAKIA